MEADRRRLPSGSAPLPMHGWLFHVRRCPHEVQSCLTDRKVPITVVLRVHGAKHLEQEARSSIKAEKTPETLFLS